MWVLDKQFEYLIPLNHTLYIQSILLYFDLALKEWKTSSYYENDIALIELDEPFKNVTPICLRKRKEKGLKKLVKKNKFIVAGE